MTLAALAPLNAVPGVTYYALQKGEAARQMQTNQSVRLTDATAELHDFDDTAAFIANLDLIVSVDTAVAHLAGAMGRPAWTMLPFSPDWRWQLGRDASAWYPTMRLFRQTEFGKWGDVVARVAQALADLRPGARV